VRQNYARTKPDQDLGILLKNANRLLRTMVLRPIDPTILLEAGGLPDPFLRSLDAIHVVTAVRMRSSIDAFVSYDHRQAAAARDEGLRVVSPGASIDS
jgi:predicted nucleic acid-binding protein